MQRQSACVRIASVVLAQKIDESEDVETDIARFDVDGVGYLHADLFVERDVGRFTVKRTAVDIAILRLVAVDQEGVGVLDGAAKAVDSVLVCERKRAVCDVVLA